MFRRQVAKWLAKLSAVSTLFILLILQLTKTFTGKNALVTSKVSVASDIISETMISKALADSRFRLTYMPADQYKGPIVERWPPNADRTMSRYISENAYISSGFSSCMKLNKVKLLIIVKSAAPYADRRQTNRLTWVKAARAYPHILVLNVVANQADEKVNSALHIEMEAFCDILQVNVVDHYMNNTLKMVSVLKFLSLQDKIDPDFVLMTDDDSFVNVPLLWQILFDDKIITRHNTNIWGSLFPGGTMMRPEPNDQSELILPSVCPMYMYDAPKYPDFLSGSGYLLPVSTIPCIFNECMRMPFFHIDDVFITGMAAERCAFKRRQFPGFHPGRVRLEEIEVTDILTHWTDHNQKNELFRYFESMPIPNITNFMK